MIDGFNKARCSHTPPSPRLPPSSPHQNKWANAGFITVICIFKRGKHDLNSFTIVPSSKVFQKVRTHAGPWKHIPKAQRPSLSHCTSLATCLRDFFFLQRLFLQLFLSLIFFSCLFFHPFVFLDRSHGCHFFL